MTRYLQEIKRYSCSVLRSGGESEETFKYLFVHVWSLVGQLQRGCIHHQTKHQKVHRHTCWKFVQSLSNEGEKNGWKAFVLFIILCQVQFALASSHVWQIWVQDSFYVRAVIFRWSESVRGRWTWLGCRKRRVRCCRRKRLESLAVWKWHWFNISQRQISRWRRSDWFYCCWMALAGLVTVTSDGTNQPGPKCFLQGSKSF